MIDSTNQFQVGVFRALAHPTRLRILERLRAEEMSVGELCAAVGIEQANASQHLAVLRGKFLVTTRQEGNQIFYRLRDPLLTDVLETVRKYFYAHMRSALAMLGDDDAGILEPGERPRNRR